MHGSPFSFILSSFHALWVELGDNDEICLSRHAVAIASAQKNKGSLEAESIVRAASTRVRFHLSTTPFCSGVRGVEGLEDFFGSSWKVSLKHSGVFILRT
ncbi:hypothetical protein Tco_0836303 [Tanacetum coccineum]